jgi:hypothetical protein
VNKGDTVRIIQRCGGHIEGMEPEVYEIGETYTVLNVVMTRAPDGGGSFNKKEPGLMLKPDARFSIPLAAVELVSADPVADLQAWVEKMKQPQPFRKPQCTGCCRILRLDEHQKNGYWCNSCMRRLTSRG